MSQYLLPCQCGAKVPVQRSQAGMSVSCPSCGANVDVPTIRRLAEYAATTDSPLPVLEERRPSVFLGLLAALGLIVGLVGVVYGAYLYWERSSYEKYLATQNMSLSMNEEDYLADMRKMISKSSPADTWDYWNYLVDEGLRDPNPPDFFRIKRYLEAQSKWMYGSLTAGGVGLGIFALLALVSSRGRKRKP